MGVVSSGGRGGHLPRVLRAELEGRPTIYGTHTDFEDRWHLLPLGRPAVVYRDDVSLRTVRVRARLPHTGTLCSFDGSGIVSRGAASHQGKGERRGDFERRGARARDVRDETYVLLTVVDIMPYSVPPRTPFSSCSKNSFGRFMPLSPR